MEWWVLIPVVSMITGPTAMYFITRDKRREREAEERYQDLARRYEELLADTDPRELPRTHRQDP
ncbi:hypothetical protein [Streptomyces sp. NPDC058045]|uniref:hypothetical protein n=1 Tax=Streptomyces sp. NPDC058045 TaxID=3346311 RepID=UPI0036F0D16F